MCRSHICVSLAGDKIESEEKQGRSAPDQAFDDKTLGPSRGRR
jgi:hypothetical protein